jgi:hypothetical protein
MRGKKRRSGNVSIHLLARGKGWPVTAHGAAAAVWFSARGGRRRRAWAGWADLGHEGELQAGPTVGKIEENGNGPHGGLGRKQRIMKMGCREFFSNLFQGFWVSNQKFKIFSNWI